MFLPTLLLRNQLLALEKSPSLPLKMGSTGFAVQLVQEALVRLGFPMPGSTKPDGTKDGIWGPETERTVLFFKKQYGSSHGLLINAIIDPATVRILEAILSIVVAPAHYQVGIHLRCTGLAGKAKYPDPTLDPHGERLKVSVSIGQIFFRKAFEAAKTFYGRYNIHLMLLSNKILTLTPAQEEELRDLDVDFCLPGMPSLEQSVLYAADSSCPPTEVTAYLVNTIKTETSFAIAHGCASSLRDKPSFIVSSVNMAYPESIANTFAHELGHVLLRHSPMIHHIDEKGNIMTTDTLFTLFSNVYKPLKDCHLNATQLKEIYKSSLLKKMG